MKVDFIRREETEGFFRKTPVFIVGIRLDFTEGEQEILIRQGWGALALISFGDDEDAVEFSVADIYSVSSQEFKAGTISDADHMESILRENVTSLGTALAEKRDNPDEQDRMDTMEF